MLGKIELQGTSVRMAMGLDLAVAVTRALLIVGLTVGLAAGTPSATPAAWEDPPPAPTASAR